MVCQVLKRMPNSAWVCTAVLHEKRPPRFKQCFILNITLNRLPWFYFSSVPIIFSLKYTLKKRKCTSWLQTLPERLCTVNLSPRPVHLLTIRMQQILQKLQTIPNHHCRSEDCVFEKLHWNFPFSTRVHCLHWCHRRNKSNISVYISLVGGLK